eukprot:1386044-Rhodomonas_salina.1
MRQGVSSARERGRERERERESGVERLWTRHTETQTHRHTETLARTLLGSFPQHEHTQTRRPNCSEQVVRLPLHLRAHAALQLRQLPLPDGDLGRQKFDPAAQRRELLALRAPKQKKARGLSTSPCLHPRPTLIGHVSPTSEPRTHIRALSAQNLC